MTGPSFIFLTALVLPTAQWLAESTLALVNRRHVLAHRDKIPDALHGSMDFETYQRSGKYTLARLQFGMLESAWALACLLFLLSSGFLPLSHGWATSHWGESAWAQAIWLFLVGMALAIPAMPFEWWAQFRLEDRFGFNTTTLSTWLLDRIKGWMVAILLGWPLLVLILKLVDWMGSFWWIWAWLVLSVFQLLMMVIAPIWILPLFNKLTPLPDGPLRDRLLQLGQRTGFSAQTILVMDGSKRSRHSNAFFTGFGRFRKIVLFDTLIQQLGEGELEAVLAHEIGHYKRGHIPKMLLAGSITSLLGLGVLAWLARLPEFTAAFGFAGVTTLAPALLLFALLSGAVTFWTSPWMNAWSRRHEFEADAYAAQVLKTPDPLVGALRKLNEKNLSNLTPHPIYSAWHYSHPTLLEREAALTDLALPTDPAPAAIGGSTRP